MSHATHSTTHFATVNGAHPEAFSAGLFSSVIRYIKDRREHAQKRKTIALLNSLAASHECVSPSMAKELRALANGK